MVQSVTRNRAVFTVSREELGRCVYQALYLIFLKQGFLLNLELAVSGRLEGQGTLACLCPFHQH